MEDNTNTPAPTAQVLSDDTSFTVTDSTGRKLSYKPLGLTKRSRLMRALGADNAANQMYFGHAVIAAGVYEIAHVGSAHDGAPAHELGSDTVPQRSFLAGAAYRNEEEIAELIGQAVFDHLFGGDL